MVIIKISTPYITLSQLLKFANIASDGAHAKYLVTEGFTSLNGQTEVRRGKKIYDGDVVEVAGEGINAKIKVEGE